MKYLGLITARGGSKRIPGKNIKLLGGYPLIWYTIQEALNSVLRDHHAGNVIAISTDDPAILAAAQMYFTATSTNGAIVPIVRPPELATDTAEHLPVLIHALEQFNRSPATASRFDAVVTLHPTSPFRKSFQIDEAIRLFEKHGGKNLVGMNDETMTRNAGLYITPVRDLYTGAIKIYNNDSLPYYMGGEPWSLDINTLEDWARAEEVALRDKIIWTV